ncbi:MULTISPECIES: CsbA family protein [Bacillus]|uniref:CsbA family protein n=1 Tax=Bacillus TaxID=1386 RepID=UPI00031218ED|nr:MULTISPECIES: DUF2198 family protein [Bacillus]
MTWILAAMTLPALLVYVFTRVTYNHFVGLSLSVALIAASAYAGYTDTWTFIILDAISLTFGLWLSIRFIKHNTRQGLSQK